MKSNDVMMFLVIAAIVASVFAVFISIWTLSINHKRIAYRQADPDVQQEKISHVSALSDPSITYSPRSMSERRENIENVLRRLEAAE